MAPPNPELFFGPMLIGVFLNTILYGVLVVQTFNYFQTYKTTDKPLIRYLVIYLLVLETFNTGCVMEMMYDILVKPLGMFLFLFQPVNSLILTVLCRHRLRAPPFSAKVPSWDQVFISTPVQLFMARRICVLSESVIVPIIISVLSFVSLGGGTALSILVTVIPDFSRFNEFYPAVSTWLGASALADLLITGCLLFTLQRKRTGMRATDGIINKIMLLTIQTGLITTVFAIADLVLAFNFIPDFALSKLYTNTLLASLNARTDYGAILSSPDNLLFRSNADTRKSRVVSIPIQFVS
ncbi:hypothetical protein PC9H_011156 [Pleurotus ostreatus]|uniref:DUF6534 domain-containing protein n=1 Tax=Pleurotus ostreatus TaxID=5322 RepID=A0A8H6ZT03_PLEOS|nr:uncharacterized protein PC9H_011156 [Pleurotus ostreatus]KAF7422992.1 hypothetical protein PC9H_011156 [Pleurotus ostreatus]